MRYRPADSAPPSGTFHLTGRGVLYLLLTVAVGLAALWKGSNLLFLVFTTLCGLLAASALFAWRMPSRIGIARILPETAEAEDPFEYALRISNGSSRWPACYLRIQDRLLQEGRAALVAPSPVFLPLLRPGERIRARVTAVPPQRGRAKLGPVRISSEFPPGLFARTRIVPLDDEIVVFPRRALLRRRILNPYRSRRHLFVPSPLSPVRGEEEFAGLREFRPGDNPKRIHWKLSARLPERTLMREFEETQAKNALLLLDTSLPASADLPRRLRLERAVAFAAALAERLLSENYRVTFRTFAPDPVEIRLEPRPGALDDLLYSLALLQPGRTGAAADLLSPGAGTNDEICFLLLTTSAPPPRWPLPDRTVFVTPSDMRTMLLFEDREKEEVRT